MNIFCITPIYEPNIEYLRQNIESVRNQTIPVKHVLVFDGSQGFLDVQEFNNKAISETKLNLEGIEIIHLPEVHADYGDTPRFIGSISAFSRGADAVFWIDDDNWIEPTHAEIMSADLRETQPIATCQRNICTLEGEVMGECFETDPYKFIDMNCYMIYKSAKEICSVLWTMNSDLHIFDDKVLYASIRKNKIPFSYYKTPTVNYRTNFNFHYHYYKYPVPAGAKDGVGVQYAKKKNETMV